MSDKIRIDYAADMSATLEAMMISGQHAIRPKRIIHSILSGITIILFAGGGAVLLIWLGILISGEAAPYVPFSWIGAIFAGLFFLFAQRWPAARIAETMTSSSYGSVQQWAEFDAQGFTIGNANANWQTDWAAVDGIYRGKRGLVLRVAATAFAVPISAITDVDDVLDKLNAWKSVA